MKLTTLLFIGIVLSFSTACGQSYNQNGYGEAARPANYGNVQYAAYNGSAGSPVQQAGNNGDVVMHPLRDSQTGMIIGHYPLPSNWKITGKAWTGPGESQVQARNGGVFSNLQRQVQSVDQIIREDLLPQLQQGGYQVINTINLPTVAQKDQQQMAQFWSSVPNRKIHESKGVEYRTNNGFQGIVIIHFNKSITQHGSVVTYTMHILHAKAKQYEKAKKDVIYALSNSKLNPQYVAVFNRKEQQKSQASWSAHRQRMADNQRMFERNQQTQRTLSEVGDIYYEGWKSRQQASDRMQEKTIDAIHGREAAVNPYTGQAGKVQSGYKYYYINQFGEYIGTNDEFYNPAMDPNVNNYEWRKASRPGNGNY